jgi:hypothetical protein
VLASGRMAPPLFLAAAALVLSAGPAGAQASGAGSLARELAELRREAGLRPVLVGERAQVALARAERSSRLSPADLRRSPSGELRATVVGLPRQRSPLREAALRGALLDPRLVALAPDERGLTLVWARRELEPRLVVGDPLDPLALPALELVVGRRAPLRLFERGPTGWRELPLAIETTTTPLGALHVAASPRRSALGVGTELRLLVGERQLTARVGPLPASVAGRGWAFAGGLRAGERRLFLDTVASFRAPARRILRQLSGGVLVQRGSCGATSCAGFDGRLWFIRLHPAQLRERYAPFLIAHELGHLVEELGLDQAARSRFQRAFRRSARWTDCFRARDGRCTPEGELFADQFAFYALGRRDGRAPASGYGTRPLLEARRFQRLLVEGWVLRPRLHGSDAFARSGS